ncbi:MAG: Crp/Fnr family transcriptional regulator [Bacteriovoracaceae bacterium]|nr:Crp/Fnr family transcriptional regulator [Bacteriovoracaceae bacterium]
MDFQIAIETFVKYLSQLHPLDPQIQQLVSKLLWVRTFKKGEIFIKDGEVAKEFGFIIKGLARGYYLTKDRVELTKSIWWEGHFMSSYRSLLLNKPSNHYVQALEETTCLMAAWSDFVDIAKGNYSLQVILKKINEQQYLEKEEREYQFMTMSLIERYRALLEQNPGIEKRIPQLYLASYLGTTPSSLSRAIRLGTS